VRRGEDVAGRAGGLTGMFGGQITLQSVRWY
jgi:hypothetical protein